MPKKQKERKGKKVRKKHEKMKKGAYYKIEGDTATKERRSCPKCGGGVFLAEHKNRFSCGKCSYTEWKKQ